MKKITTFFALCAALLIPAALHAQGLSLPINQGFENGMDGWTMVRADGSTGTTSSFSGDVSAAHGGSSAFNFHYNYNPPQYLISPEIDATSGPADFTFWYAAASSSYPESFNVGYSTTTSDTSAFTWSPTITYNQSVWTEYTQMLPAGVKYVAIRYTAYDMFYLYIDDIYLGDPPTCFAVSGLTASSITTSGATISWTDDMNTGASYAVRYWAAGSTDTTTLANVSDTTVDLTDLSSATLYEWEVRAVCGSDDHSFAAYSSFYTACEVITEFPWTETFSSPWTAVDGGIAAPSCWTVLDVNGDGDRWFYTSSGLNGGSAKIYTDFHSSNNDWLITPAFQLDGNRLLTFSARNSSATTSEQDEIAVWISDEDLADFTLPLNTSDPIPGFTSIFQTIIPIGDAETYEVSLQGYTGTRYIAFVRKEPPANGWNLYLDDVTVTVLPECSRPIVSNVDVTVDQAVITWTSTGTDFVVSYKPDTDTTYIESTDFIAGDSNYSITISALLPNTNYDFYVTALCGDDSVSSRAGAFLTPCLAIVNDSLPWTEGFESYPGSSTAFNADCYTVLNRYSSSYPSVTSSSSYVHSGNQALYVYSYGGDLATIVALPNFEAAPEELMLSFWLRRSSSGVGVEAGIISNLADPSSFQPFATCIPQQSNTYQEFSATFVGATSGYIALRYVGPNYNSVYIDDITVQELPSCTAPSAIAISDVTTDGATLTITDPNDVGHYYVVYGTDSVEVNGQTYDFADLLSGTTYNVRVYTVCGDSLLGPVYGSFMTNLESVDLPYATGFEVGDDSVWTFFNGTNAWAIGSATNNGGSRALYISNDNGTSNSYSNGSSTVSYAIRALNLESAGEYAYSFDWKGNGENGYDYLRAWLAPGTPTVVANQLPNGSTGTSSYTDVTPTGWTDLANGQMQGSSNWQTQDGTINIADEGTYCLVFMWVNDGGAGSNPPAAVDNVAFMRNTCSRPDAIVVDSTDTENIYVHWNAVEGVNEYALTVNGEVLTTSDTSFTIDNLAPNTAYFIALRSICGGDDTSMAVSTSARTACAVITTLPWIEGFESYDVTTSHYNIPCWDNVRGSSSANIVIADAAARVHSGNRSMRFSGYAAQPNTMVLPEFADDISGLEMSFWSVAEGSGSGWLRVGYVTDPTDTTTFVQTAAFYETQQHVVVGRRYRCPRPPRLPASQQRRSVGSYHHRGPHLHRRRKQCQ